MKLIIAAGISGGYFVEAHVKAGEVIDGALVDQLQSAAERVSFHEAAESPQYGREGSSRDAARARLAAAYEWARRVGVSVEFRGYLL